MNAMSPYIGLVHEYSYVSKPVVKFRVGYIALYVRLFVFITKLILNYKKIIVKILI